MKAQNKSINHRTMMIQLCQNNGLTKNKQKVKKIKKSKKEI
jgi:hypothetical protein